LELIVEQGRVKGVRTDKNIYEMTQKEREKAKIETLPGDLLAAMKGLTMIKYFQIPWEPILWKILDGLQCLSGILLEPWFTRGSIHNILLNTKFQ
jgi:hypothetical protein